MSYDPQAQAMPAPSAPMGKQPGWFGRNWLWFVPLILSPFCLCGVCVAGLTIFGLSQGELYMKSLETVQASPQVQEALGSPIEPVPFQAEISSNTTNGVTTGECTYTVKGSKGTASVHAVAEKSGDTWTYKEHTVTINGSDTVIDLLQ